MVANIEENGVAIFGIPSQESQKYASEISRQGHVNCKTGDELKSSLTRFFNNVFIFSMNDEVVHTGFLPLSHYLIALCCAPLVKKFNDWKVQEKIFSLNISRDIKLTYFDLLIKFDTFFFFSTVYNFDLKIKF